MKNTNLEKGNIKLPLPEQDSEEAYSHIMNLSFFQNYDKTQKILLFKKLE
jgi:hypothetical protein